MPDELKKRMVVCTPFGPYVNGEDKGEMTPARLKRIAANFKKYPRQVPIYAMGDHAFDPDERLPDGWVEDVFISDTGALGIAAKIHGMAAEWVADDLIRGASIGTVMGRNPDGTEQGEVLQHVLLTNGAFDKNVNIAAAARLQGGEPVASYFTALPLKEADMADPKKMEEELSRLREENESLTGQIAALKAEAPDKKAQELEAILTEKNKECLELKASNENLKEEVARFKTNPELEQAMVKLKAQDRQLRAAKIRRLVKDGVTAGQFSIALVGEPKAGYDHQSDEQVLSWFKGSHFDDSISNLEFALKTLPKKALGRQFRSGEPSTETTEPTLTEEERASLRKRGIDPEHVLLGMKARAGSFTDYKALKQAHKES